MSLGSLIGIGGGAKFTGGADKSSTSESNSTVNTTTTTTVRDIGLTGDAAVALAGVLGGTTVNLSQVTAHTLEVEAQEQGKSFSQLIGGASELLSATRGSSADFLNAGRGAEQDLLSAAGGFVNAGRGVSGDFIVASRDVASSILGAASNQADKNVEASRATATDLFNGAQVVLASARDTAARLTGGIDQGTLWLIGGGLALAVVIALMVKR